MNRQLMRSRVVALCCFLTLLPAGLHAGERDRISPQWPRRLQGIQLLPVNLRVEDSDSSSRALGLGRHPRSLPLWARVGAEAGEQLSTNARALRAGIMLVGTPKGEFGTAFVISRKHRLLATNAHVADILHKAGSLTAIRNGTTDACPVKNVWYHPGVCRLLRDRLPVRSRDPKEGKVFPYSADVAVLQLAEGGPELPFEVQLASWEEIEDLFAQPLGMLGYPGHDTTGWPAWGRKPVATFHGGGTVCRVTDFNQNADADRKALQYVQHSISSWPGFSGSPLFLPNGHVVAIHNAGRTVAASNDPNFRTNLAYGIRIDCLWELLAYHGLDRRVPIPVSKETLLLARFDRPDPTSEKFRAAVALNDEARQLIWNEELRRGLTLCEAGLKEVPYYPDFYYTRALACVNIVSREYSGRPLSNEGKRRLLEKSLESLRTYIRLVPSDPEGILFYAHLLGTMEWDANQTVPEPDRKWTRTIELVDVLTKLLSTDNLSPSTRAGILSKRGELRSRLNQRKEALADLDEAIRVFPWRMDCYLLRAYYWEEEGRHDLAREDRARADDLKPSRVR